MKSLRVSISAKCGAAHSSFIQSQIKRAHAMLGSSLAELSIALVGDRQMSDLHFHFMSIAGPTDVLTFPLEMDARGQMVCGEIIICVPEGRRRARQQGVPLAHELLLYAVHGMLHLSGYDDKTAREFKIMHRTEDDLLTRLGVGAVFHPLRSPTASVPRNRKVR
jgi:probable rRNA maturation factor